MNNPDPPNSRRQPKMSIFAATVVLLCSKQSFCSLCQLLVWLMCVVRMFLSAFLYCSVVCNADDGAAHPS